MSEEGFKNYIKNRSVADIMEDYGDQRDEWQTLLIIENNAVVKFRHSNGKVYFCDQYSPDGEEYKVSEKQLELLTGKTVEQQMEHYFVTESHGFYKTAYSEISKEDLRKKATKLSDYDGVKTLLLKDKILVGAMIRCPLGDKYLLPECPVCTYYAYDNEGSGTSEREGYAYLIFTE